MDLVNTVASCPHDLLALSRRRTLTALESQRLSLHISKCRDCQLAARVGADFDQLPGVMQGDELIVQRATETLLHHRAAARAASSKRLTAMAVGLMVVLIGGVAVAWVSSHYALQRRPSFAPQAREPAPDLPTQPISDRPTPPPPETTMAHEAPRPRRSQTPDTRAGRQVAKPPAAKKKVAQATTASMATEPAPSPTVLEPRNEAEHLLVRANAARSLGRSEEAATLYAQLQRQHANTKQALVSLVSAGQMYLAAKAGSQAEAMFRSYLQRAPAGALYEEALRGRAEALALLANRAAEKVAWQDLLREFPHSAYARRAHQRLGPAPQEQQEQQ